MTAEADTNPGTWASLCAIGLSRVVGGLALVAAPRPPARRIFGGGADPDPALSALVSTAGVRDAAVGAAAVAGVSRGDTRSARFWLVAGVAMDGVDAAANALAWRRTRRAACAGLALLAGSATATQALALRGLPETPGTSLPTAAPERS